MTSISGLFTKIRAASDAAVGAFSSSFTGVNSGVTRTDTSAMPNDSRREQTSFTRIQLRKKSRWLCNNLGLVRRFVNGTARYSVGTGISHIPATKDDDWNDLADDYFTQWASSQMLCDVRGKQSFWRMQKSILRAMFRDGDAFCLKTPMPPQVLSSGIEVPGTPQLQWVESHTIGNPFVWNDLDSDGYREGILATDQGLPVSYNYLSDSNPKLWDLSKSTKLDADAVMHVFDDERATQMRGLPWIYHGVNSAVDILDLNALEKASVKLHSAMAAAIKKKTADAGRGGFTGDLTKKRGTMADGKKKITAYENFAGGAGILNLELDEEFQLFTSNRPSVTFSGFIDYLVRDMAWGFGVSPEFIWSVSGMGGPNTRFILEDAKWFFEEIQDLLVDLFCRKVYVWVIARAIERGELRACTDPRWWICDWVGPAKVTIDQGRDGQTELDRLRNACGTWEEYWAARGKSGKLQVRRRIDELHEAMEYAKKKGVPFEYVLEIKPGAPVQGDPSGKPKAGGFSEQQQEELAAMIDEHLDTNAKT